MLLLQNAVKSDLKCYMQQNIDLQHNTDYQQLCIPG